MATFWERAAHSADHMFSLYFDYLYFCYFPFGLKLRVDLVWDLIPPVTGHCIFVTFNARNKN